MQAPNSPGVFIVETCCFPHNFFGYSFATLDKSGTSFTIHDIGPRSFFALPEPLKKMVEKKGDDLSVRDPIPDTERLIREIAKLNISKDLRFGHLIYRSASPSHNITAVSPRPTFSQTPEQRIALVIGNFRYNALEPLNNAGNDATAIALQLELLGFDVETHTNLTQESFLHVLRDFSAKAQKAAWAIVYFAGHGISKDGIDYLIPADAKLESDRDVDFETVTLDQVLKSVEGAKKLHLVILDACRNNPFLSHITHAVASRSVTRGLAAI